MGIGKSIAEMFYNEGANVAVFDREYILAQQWINESYPSTDNASSRLLAVECDVSNETSVEKAVQTVVQQFHTIDVLVNNAATFVYGTIDQVTNEQWDRTLNVNIKGYAFCMKYVIPVMKAKKPVTKGSIVNISSISAFCGQEEFVPYSVTKAAVLQMSRNVAMDVGKFNIRVNCVSPGPILTEATSRHAKGIGKTVDEVINDLTSHLILKRMGKPEEVAKAVSWLASEDSSFTTGSNIMVDGGYLLV